MLERIINMLMWIDTTFSRTSDPVLADYRNCQQQLLLSGALTVMGLLGAYMSASLRISPSTALQEFVNQIAGLAALVCLAVSMVTLLWFAWATYRLWRFTTD